MANLAELSQWADGIHQLDTTDEAIGGPDGMANLQAKQLANRTQFLKAMILAAQNSLADHESAADPHPQYLTTAEGNSIIATAVAELVGQSPVTLNTLNELAAALGNDPNFATTITTALGNKQPLDATLTALAALATTANKLIYATGQDTFLTTDLTAFARSLLDDGDAATMRATLGIQNLDFTASLAGNGYQKLPSGLIIQWGLWTGSITGLSYTSISYPISFPNGVFYTNAAIQAVGVNNQIAEKLITIEGLPYGLSRFLLTNTDGDSPIQILRWFSIGY